MSEITPEQRKKAFALRQAKRKASWDSVSLDPEIPEAVAEPVATPESSEGVLSPVEPDTLGNIGGVAIAGSEQSVQPTLRAIDGGKAEPRRVPLERWKQISADGEDGQGPLQAAARKAEIAHLIGGPNEWSPPVTDAMSRSESQKQA